MKCLFLLCAFLVCACGPDPYVPETPTAEQVDAGNVDVISTGFHEYLPVEASVQGNLGTFTNINTYAHMILLNDEVLEVRARHLDGQVMVRLLFPKGVEALLEEEQSLVLVGMQRDFTGIGCQGETIHLWDYDRPVQIGEVYVTRNETNWHLNIDLTWQEHENTLQSIQVFMVIDKL